MTNPADLQMPAFDLDTAIRLRWALRDIKGNRTGLTPVSADDLKALLELGFVEMRGDVPVVTTQGNDVLGWH